MSQQQEYDDELRGVLFPERDKKSDRHPDFTGKVTVSGTDYRIAAWKRASRADNKPFLSLTLEEAKVPTPEEVDPEGALDL
jgi:uncharacterized protein (DUF736 family)